MSYRDPPSNETLELHDALGRDHSLPWTTCRTWRGMQTMINILAAHDQAIKGRVQACEYDLFGPNGNIILPDTWETTVRPGWRIEMRLRPYLQDDSQCTPARSFSSRAVSCDFEGCRQTFSNPSDLQKHKKSCLHDASHSPSDEVMQIFVRHQFGVPKPSGELDWSWESNNKSNEDFESKQKISNRNSISSRANSRGLSRASSWSSKMKKPNTEHNDEVENRTRPSRRNSISSRITSRASSVASSVPTQVSREESSEAGIALQAIRDSISASKRSLQATNFFGRTEDQKSLIRFMEQFELDYSERYKILSVIDDAEINLRMNNFVNTIDECVQRPLQYRHNSTDIQLYSNVWKVLLNLESYIIHILDYLDISGGNNSRHYPPVTLKNSVRYRRCQICKSCGRDYRYRKRLKQHEKFCFRSKDSPDSPTESGIVIPKPDIDAMLKESEDIAAGKIPIRLQRRGAICEGGTDILVENSPQSCTDSPNPIDSPVKRASTVRSPSSPPAGLDPRSSADLQPHVSTLTAEKRGKLRGLLKITRKITAAWRRRDTH